MDILEMIKNTGAEIPEDKTADFDKMFRKAYKSVAELDTVKEELKTAKESLAQANAKIQEFAAMDIDGIKKEAADWKAKAELAETEAATRIAELEFDGILSEKLSSEKFSSDYAKRGVMADIKAKGLKVENGAILGLDDALKTLKESQASAFVAEDQNPNKLMQLPPSGSVPGSGVTKEAFAKMGYKERAEMHASNPALYQTMKE